MLTSIAFRSRGHQINQISLPDGSSVLHFEHPTEPGFKSGGWMGGLVGEYKVRTVQPLITNRKDRLSDF